MSIRYGFNYHTDENISNLAMMIMQKANQLKPDYLEIDGLANVFNYHYMKNVMGIAYDSMNYIYIVRTQGGETIEAKANDEIVYLGLGEWKFYNRERG